MVARRAARLLDTPARQGIPDLHRHHDGGVHRVHPDPGLRGRRDADLRRRAARRRREGARAPARAGGVGTERHDPHEGRRRPGRGRVRAQRRDARRGRRRRPRAVGEARRSRPARERDAGGRLRRAHPHRVDRQRRSVGPDTWDPRSHTRPRVVARTPGSEPPDELRRRVRRRAPALRAAVRLRRVGGDRCDRGEVVARGRDPALDDPRATAAGGQDRGGRCARAPAALVHLCLRDRAGRRDRRARPARARARDRRARDRVVRARVRVLRVALRRRRRARVTDGGTAERDRAAQPGDPGIVLHLDRLGAGPELDALDRRVAGAVLIGARDAGQDLARRGDGARRSRRPSSSWSGRRRSWSRSRDACIRARCCGSGRA